MRYVFKTSFILVLTTIILSACGNYNSWLEAHNQYRCMHGVPLLKWDSVLAEVATWRAKNCPYGVHCRCTDPSCNPIYSKVYGENAAWYTAAPNKVVEDWYSEINNYVYNNPQWSDNTGHFINIVNNVATKVGCACLNNRCFCDYDTVLKTFPPTSQELTQIVPKPIKTLAQCSNPTP
jgi:hypothetical protein